MYPQSILDEIKDRVSIAALIGERVPLKKAGRNYKGLCPFHSEKTSSFMVSDEKQIYHCFGCGEGGNVFSFLMKFDNLMFSEAVELLAERAGVSLPKVGKGESKGETDVERRKKWAYRLNQIVTEYFNENLKDEKKGAAACNYLKSRDILLEKNTQHFLGYAEDRWDGLVVFLEGKKVPFKLAEEMGLVKRRSDGKYYDFFRHRIVCPVITPRGQIVAFSGRTFGRPATAEGREEPAKYLNSPDSIIYHKSHTLYGLNLAANAVRKEDSIILVEGNLDVLRLHQEGIPNAVAPLGTALTSGHLRLIGRYTKNVVVVFDGDEAGRKAAFRSLPLFLEAGMVPRAVGLPDGEDPDSFVKAHGAAAFRDLIKNAVTLFEWIIDGTVAKSGNTTDGKVKALDELRPFFEMVDNPVEATVYRKRLALRLSLEESLLVNYLSKKGPKRDIGPAVETRECPIERALVELMLSSPECIGIVYGAVDVDKFTDGAYQTIGRMIFDEFGKKGRLDVDHLVDNTADAELKREILSLAMTDGKYDDPVQAAKDCVNRIKRMFAKRRLDELNSAVQKIKDDDKSLKIYMKEIQTITKELHNIG